MPESKIFPTSNLYTDLRMNSLTRMTLQLKTSEQFRLYVTGRQLTPEITVADFAKLLHSQAEVALSHGFKEFTMEVEGFTVGGMFKDNNSDKLLLILGPGRRESDYVIENFPLPEAADMNILVIDPPGIGRTQKFLEHATLEFWAQIINQLPEKFGTMRNHTILVGKSLTTEIVEVALQQQPDYLGAIFVAGPKLIKRVWIPVMSFFIESSLRSQNFMKRSLRFFRYLERIGLTRFFPFSDDDVDLFYLGRSLIKHRRAEKNANQIGTKAVFILSHRDEIVDHLSQEEIYHQYPNSVQIIVHAETHWRNQDEQEIESINKAIKALKAT